MSYKALLFCPDEKTARTVTQVLTDLDFQVEPSNEPFATVKKLTAEHFDAIVVDCENEQNATLLFKSARNSELNQASLSIAVVEGQAGVAKAFRIGANLVLTKPINVEQSKGTIRVARGLLRKSESTRLAATSAKADQAAQSALPGPHSLSPTLSDSVPSASFELENEPQPRLEPTEAAFLESMPDPTADLTRPSVASPEKANPWQLISRPMAGALRTAADATAHSELLSSSEISASPVSPMPLAGAGAAAAPAKQRPSSRETIDASQLELPSFASATEKPRPVSSSERSGGIRPIVIAAVILLAAALGYVGFTKFQRGLPSSTLQKAAPQPQAQTAQPQAVQPPTPQAAATSPEPTASTGSDLPIDSTATNAPSAAPITSSPAKETSVPKAKKSMIASTKSDPDSDENSDEDAGGPTAIVVKRGASTPAQQRPVEQPAETTAPELNVAQDSPNDTISDLVNVSPTVPKAAQTLKISQGISQGLLIKKVAPLYPQQALQMKIQGPVELAATISKEGNITNLKRISGDAILGRAAMDAVKQWKYKPYYLDSQPVEIQTQITVVFKLP